MIIRSTHPGYVYTASTYVKLAQRHIEIQDKALPSQADLEDVQRFVHLHLNLRKACIKHQRFG